MGVQIGQILRQAARFAPDSVAVIDLGHDAAARREFTFGELHGMACALASQLMAAGVMPGDRVALVAENSAETAAAWFGILYCGAAVVPLNLLSAPRELAERVEHAGAKLVLHDRARTELVHRALHAGASPRALESFDYGATPSEHFPRDTTADASALVLYTSGTTGHAKGAAITHASLMVHTLLLVQHALGLDAGSRVLCCLPLSHSYGCRLALLAPFYARARIVTMPRFDPERSLRALVDERVTWVPAVPTMFAAWGQCQPLPAAAREHLRWALCAGAPLADATALRAEAVLGVSVRQGYGMTEATFATMNAPPDERVLGSVGKPIWGVELKITDAEGKSVPAGQSGEVLVRGHNVMSHYLFDPEATTEAKADGWVRSGDVGRLDAHGRLSIVDRIKDLIIRGGYNVYPSEVENVLGAHPKVRDVAVVGRSDAFYGEEIVAIVVPVAGQAPSAAELHAFASPQLSKTKLPREYACIDALPLGPSGKVHKRTLRTWLESGHITPEKLPP